MSAYNTTLLDEDDNEIYPKTLAENVYDGNIRMDQKVDGIRTDLGNPSSASAVTGADAFSKISKLNSDLAFKVINAGTINSVTVTKSRWILPDSVLNGYTGNYVCISGLPNGSSSAAISYNTLIGIGWTFKDVNDHSPVEFSGIYSITFVIIKML